MPIVAAPRGGLPRPGRNLCFVTVEQRPAPPAWSRPDVRIGAVIAVALAIAFIVWLIVRGNGNSSPATTQTQTQTSTVAAIAPRAATQNDLRALAVQIGHPIYWVGPQSGLVYELTRTSSDRIFVRYLPHGVAPGAKNATYTFVGTYPFSGAYRALQTLAKQGDPSFQIPGGGLAVYSPSSPTNVYVAFPGSDVEIEVYDPSAKRARALVAAGQVQPVR
jgi:hypothetical protein